MNRQELLNQIEHYTPFNEQEETDKQLILNWIRNNTNAFSRENTVAHMTASAWVVNQDKSKIKGQRSGFNFEKEGQQNEPSRIFIK